MRHSRIYRQLRVPRTFLLDILATHYTSPSMAPQFSISIESVSLPTLPQPSADELASDILRSPLIPSALRATTPLCITCALALARPKNPLYPATHLQLSYNFGNTGQVFVPHYITSEHLVAVNTTNNFFEIKVPVEDIPRPKVNHGATSTGEVAVYAWKDEKMLGKWEVCQIKGLGIEGLKSDDLAIRRAEIQRNLRRNEVQA